MTRYMKLYSTANPYLKCFVGQVGEVVLNNDGTAIFTPLHRRTLQPIGRGYVVNQYELDNRYEIIPANKATLQTHRGIIFIINLLLIVFLEFLVSVQGNWIGITLYIIGVVLFDYALYHMMLKPYHQQLKKVKTR